MRCQPPGLGPRGRRGAMGLALGFTHTLAFTTRAASLYKEDEPNVFAEPAVLARQLLPFLLQLLEKAPAASPLRASALRWLAATGPGILRDLRFCAHRWSHGTVRGSAKLLGQASWCPRPRASSALGGGHPAMLTAPSPALSAEAAARWGMKALGCAKLHVAVAVLLVRARLAAQTLQVLGEGAAAVPGLGCGAQELEQELEVVQGLLVQHGLAPVLSQGDVLGELGPPSRAA